MWWHGSRLCHPRMVSSAKFAKNMGDDTIFANVARNNVISAKKFVSRCHRSCLPKQCCQPPELCNDHHFSTLGKWLFHLCHKATFSFSSCHWLTHHWQNTTGKNKIAMSLLAKQKFSIEKTRSPCRSQTNSNTLRKHAVKNSLDVKAIILGKGDTVIIFRKYTEMSKFTHG